MAPTKRNKKTKTQDRPERLRRTGEDPLRRARGVLLGAALVLLVLIVYWPALQGAFIWDDGQHVLHNPVLRSWQGLWDLWFRPTSIPQYYPLVHTTFWIEHRLWGLRVEGYHAVNMLLHAASAVLVWRVLLRLGAPGAWFAAALFAVHPVHVETVAWITERKNVLSLACALGSMLAYLHFDPPGAAAPGRRKWAWYALSLGLFLSALLSKTVVASLPAVLLVVYWWKEGRFLKHAPALAPFFAAGVALGAVTVWLEATHVGARGEEFGLTAVERVLLAGRAAWFYASKLVAPYPLMFFYPRWDVDAAAAWQYAFPAAALALLAGLWGTRRRIGRGPLAAALVFGGVLTPALGFVDVFPFRYSYVADHFQYHASIALLALFAAGLTALAARYGARARWAPVAALLAILAVLGALARSRTHVFADVRALYEDTLAHNPDCWAAHGNLGDYWLNRREFDAAMREFRAALETAPPTAAWQMHLSLGNCLQELKRPEEALVEYDQALAGCPPEKLWIPHLHKANCLQQLDENARALEHYREAMRREPTALNADNRLNLAICLQRLGRYDEAIEQFHQSLALDPNSGWVAYFSLGRCLDEAGRAEEALPHLRRALGMEPRYLPIRTSLARALFHAGLPAEARRELEVNLDPRLPPVVRVEALLLQGEMFRAEGREEQARAAFRAALEIDPQNAPAKENLAQ